MRLLVPIIILLVAFLASFFISVNDLPSPYYEDRLNDVLRQLTILSADGKCSLEEYSPPTYFLSGPPLEMWPYMEPMKTCQFISDQNINDTIVDYRGIAKKLGWVEQYYNNEPGADYAMATYSTERADWHSVGGVLYYFQVSPTERQDYESRPYLPDEKESSVLVRIYYYPNNLELVRLSVVPVIITLTRLALIVAVLWLWVKGRRADQN